MIGVFELIKQVGERYRGAYSQDTFVISGRRWDAIELIAEGINDRNYKRSLEVVERLMGGGRGKQRTDTKEKDGIVLDKLVVLIEIYESTRYPVTPTSERKGI